MRTGLQLKTPASPARPGRSVAAAARPVARFGLHLLEMCVVMCLSLALLAVLASAVTAMTGLPDLQQEAPVLAALVVSAVLAVAMVAWMRFRKMSWRSTLEMAAPAPVAGVLLVGGYWAGIVAGQDVATSVCPVACLGMIGVMVFRFRLFAGNGGHHSQAE